MEIKIVILVYIIENPPYLFTITMSILNIDTKSYTNDIAFTGSDRKDSYSVRCIFGN